MSRTIEEATSPMVQWANLPTVLTSFIGRQREVAESAGLLKSSRLVTLTGAAGCGKTRLALRVAAEVARHYPDGTVWVELAQLDDPALVSKTVANALRVPEQPERPIIECLLDALGGKHYLLVLDNCEHMLSECARLVETLLSETDTAVMATSREPLSIAGELRYPVAPMSLPPHDMVTDTFDRYDAVRLFVERARAVLPSFDLASDNAVVVAEICRHLDGIPLAIEIASARVNVLTLEQIAERIDDRFGLLGRASHTVWSHHETLRAAIDWSYDLLTASEQAMLRRLSVFAGGCSLTTAESVCTGDEVEREQVLDVIASLVNKSLVVSHTMHRGEARYSLLETIRQYGLENLMAAGEWSDIHDRYLECFLRLTEETAPKLAGQYQYLWMDWVQAEHDNVRAALAWSLKSRRIEAGLRIAVALYQFWMIRDHAEEGLAWLDRLLEEADDGVSPVVRANALAYAGFMSGFRGNAEAQMEYGREAANLAERAGDEGKRALAWALAAQAHGARATGDFETEFAIARRAIQIYRELGDTYLLGVALSTYSTIPMLLGKYDIAHGMLDEALPLLRDIGDPYRIAMALNYSGDLARCERDYARAEVAYEESVPLLRECDAVRDLASVLHNLGHAEMHLGDTARALDHFTESMTLHQSQRNEPGMAECLLGFAALAIATGLPGAGARLLAAAVSIGGPQIATAWPATRMEYQHYLALSRSRLTEREFQEVQAEGRSLSLEQAVEFALDLPIKVQAPRAGRHPDDLTVREGEVAQLIALGKSNQEIADELSLSKRTIEKHVANILAKLNVSNRAGIVRWVLERRGTAADEI